MEKELGLAGLPAPPEELRRRLAAAVLLTELVEKSGQLAGAFKQLLPEPARRAIAVELASFWRAGIPWRESYVKWAHFVEREYRLGERINWPKKGAAFSGAGGCGTVVGSACSGGLSSPGMRASAG